MTIEEFIHILSIHIAGLAFYTIAVMAILWIIVWAIIKAFEP